MSEPKIPKSLFNQIEQGEIKMKPHWNFVMRKMLVIVAGVFLFIGLFYLGSYIGFLWRFARFHDLPRFGGTGFLLLLRSFPWLPLALFFLSIALLLHLLKNTTPTYRWPRAIVLASLTLIIAGSSVIIIRTPLHDRFLTSAQSRHLPLLGPLYRREPMRHQGWMLTGTLTQVEEEMWTVQIIGDGRAQVRVTPRTRVKPMWTPETGETIVVVGAWQDDLIIADGVLPAWHLQKRVPSPNWP